MLVKLEKISPGKDRLLKDIHHGDQYLAVQGDQVSKSLLSKLKSREIRRAWIERSYEHWFTRESARLHGIKTKATEKVPRDQGRVINKLDGITHPDRLMQLVSYVRENSQLTSKQQLPEELQTSLVELKQDEKKLHQELNDVNNSSFYQRIAAETSSLVARPGRNLKNLSLPGERQLLAGKIFRHIYQVLSVKNSFKEVLIENKNKTLIKKIQALLSQFDELEVDPDIIQILQIKSLRSEEPPIAAENSAVSEELLTPINREDISEKINNFYSTASEFYLAVAQWRTYLPHLARRLRKQLEQLLNSLPDPHWLLTDTSPQGSGLIKPGINRIVFYAQVWPEEILSSDALNRLPALLFREIGLLQNPVLVGRCHRVLPDKRAENEKIHSFLIDSTQILRQISGFPPESLEIIAHQTENAGPGAEWTIREARRVDLCAAYDLLTTNWPWRQAIAPGRAFNQLWKFTGDYGPELLNDFCSGIGVYPSGITARLTDNSSCFVERQTDNPELPLIIKIEENRDDEIKLIERLDLRESSLSIGEVPSGRVAPWSKRNCLVRDILT